MLRSLKRSLLLLLSCALIIGAVLGQTPQVQSHAPRKSADYVNGLVGTAPLDKQDLIGNAPPPGEELYTGFTSPGAVLPHGWTNLSPVNKNLDLSYPAGVNFPYVYSHRTMFGFSNGMPGMLVMPVVGDWTVPPERSNSVYSKLSEKATPGYYTVFLEDYKVKAKLTASRWTGLYCFTFPETERAHVILDLGRGVADMEIVGDHVVRGQAERAIRGQIAGTSQRGTAKIFFVAEFSKPFKAFGIFHQDVPPQNARAGSGPLLGRNTVTPQGRSTSGSYAGAYLNFATSAGEQILIKVATGDSYEAAQKHLETESPGWDFKKMKNQAEKAWNQKLNSIEVQGGTENERVLFYSNLYHAFASPRLVAKKGDSFTGLDGKIHGAEYDRYGPVPFWDTGRNQTVLLTLVEPTVKLDILRSTLDMARETGWMQTSFHGDHGILMYLGDWQRGLTFDWEAAYEFLRKNATDTNGPRRNLSDYLKRGWVPDVVVEHPSPPYAGGNAGVAKTLAGC